MLDDNSRIEVIVINSRPTLISLINLYMPSSRSRGDLVQITEITEYFYV